MVYPVAEIKRGQTFLLFGYVNGIQGDVTTDWTDRNIIPYYKGTWGNLRKAGTMDEFKRTVRFKNCRSARPTTPRPDTRRVGKEWARTGTSRGCDYQQKKN